MTEKQISENNHLIEIVKELTNPWWKARAYKKLGNNELAMEFAEKAFAKGPLENRFEINTEFNLGKETEIKEYLRNYIQNRFFSGMTIGDIPKLIELSNLPTNEIKDIGRLVCEDMAPQTKGMRDIPKVIKLTNYENDVQLKKWGEAYFEEYLERFSKSSFMIKNYKKETVDSFRDCLFIIDNYKLDSPLELKKELYTLYATKALVRGIGGLNEPELRTLNGIRFFPNNLDAENKEKLRTHLEKNEDYLDIVLDLYRLKLDDVETDLIDIFGEEFRFSESYNHVKKREFKKQQVDELIQEGKFQEAMRIAGRYRIERSFPEKEIQKRLIEKCTRGYDDGFYDSEAPEYKKLTDESKYFLFAREFRRHVSKGQPEYAQEVALEMGSPMRFNYAFRRTMQQYLEKEHFDWAKDHLKKSLETKYATIISEAPEVDKLNKIFQLIQKEP